VKCSCSGMCDSKKCTCHKNGTGCGIECGHKKKGLECLNPWNKIECEEIGSEGEMERNEEGLEDQLSEGEMERNEEGLEHQWSGSNEKKKKPKSYLRFRN